MICGKKKTSFLTFNDNLLAIKPITYICQLFAHFFKQGINITV